MSAAARLLPHLPTHLQRTVDVSKVRQISHIGGPLHITLRAYRNARSTLDVETVAAIAARAADGPLITELATDRRVSVRDALATNPNLPASIARTLLDQTLSEKVGRSGAIRWGRLCALAGHIITLEGQDAAPPIIRRMTALRSKASGRWDAPGRQDAINMLSTLDGPTIRPLITDGTITTLTGISPLALLRHARHDDQPHPWGAETTICAIEKEAEGGASMWSTNRRGEHTIPDHEAVHQHILNACDPKKAGRIANALQRADSRIGGAIVADLLQNTPDSSLDDLHSTLQIDPPMLAAAAAATSRNRSTLTLRSRTIHAISRLRTPDHGRYTISTLLADAHTIRLSEDAERTLASIPRSLGADLLTIIAVAGGLRSEAMLRRLEHIDIATLTLGDWHNGTGDTLDIIGDLIHACSHGDPETHAGRLAAIAEAAPHASHRGRQVERIMRSALEKRQISIADLAAAGGENTVAAIAGIITERAAEGRAASGIRRGDLSRASDSNLTRLAALLLQSYGPHDKLTILKDRNLQRDDILIPAILHANITREALTGERTGKLSDGSIRRLIGECLKRSPWERSREMQNIVSAAAATLDRYGQLPWIGIIAETVPLRELRMPRTESEWYSRVEAEVLLHTVGDDADHWATLDGLAESWQGTAAELAATIHVLAGRR